MSGSTCEADSADAVRGVVHAGWYGDWYLADPGIQNSQQQALNACGRITGLRLIGYFDPGEMGDYLVLTDDQGRIRANAWSLPKAARSETADAADASKAAWFGYTSKGSLHTQMTQFPAIAGMVAIIGNTPGTFTSSIYLTEKELCNIFAGKITKWNQLVQKDGTKFASNLPITLVGRSDGSGTTFGFTNYMNWVCSDSALGGQTLHSAAVSLPLATNFNVTSTFSPSFFPGGAIPAGATVVTASGNPGVVSTVDATDGSIGYAEVANITNLLYYGSHYGSSVTMAAVAAKDTVELRPADGVATPRNADKYLFGDDHPALFDVPETFVDKDGASYSAVFIDRALQGNDATHLRPVGTPTALTSTQVPNANCVFLMHPGAYATTAYKTAGVPTSGYKRYPIVAVSYLFGNYDGNGANTADVTTLLSSPYETTLRRHNGGPVTRIGSDTGYSFFTAIKGEPLAGGAKIQLGPTRVSKCIN